LLAQKTEHNWHSFADMKGHSVATVTGFTLVPELKKVDGIGEVKLYDTSDGVMQDLVAGRVDMAILDPPLYDLVAVQCRQQRQPGPVLVVDQRRRQHGRGAW